MELGEGFVGRAQGVQHRELTPPLAVEHDLGEVPHHGGDEEQANGQGEDHRGVVLQALDAGLKVVARGGDHPIREGGDSFTNLALGDGYGIHIGARLHVDLQLGAGGGTARQSGVGGVRHAEGDGVLGVQTADHGADREGLVAELEILDLQAEQLTGVKDHLQATLGALKDCYHDLVAGTEIVGLFVIDVLADDDGIGLGQNGVGIALEGAEAVAGEVVDPQLIHHGVGIVVDCPLVALLIVTHYVLVIEK